VTLPLNRKLERERFVSSLLGSKFLPCTWFYHRFEMVYFFKSMAFSKEIWHFVAFLGFTINFWYYHNPRKCNLLHIVHASKELHLIKITQLCLHLKEGRNDWRWSGWSVIASIHRYLIQERTFSWGIYASVILVWVQ
jgi:hypothetical protein